MSGGTQGINQRQTHQRKGTAAAGAANGGGMSNGGQTGGPGQVPAGRPPGPPLIFRDAASAKLMLPHPLVLPSLLVLPLLLWAVAVLVGSLHNEALPDGADKRTFQHPLSDFDRYVFRVWGPLLPLAAFALRLLAGLARLPPSPPTAAGRPTPLRPGVTLAMRALVLYVAVAAVRVAVYLGHVAVQRQAELFLMSDHLLLAASMVSCLQSEMLLALSDMYKMELLRDAFLRQAAVAASLVLAALTALTVAADMYFTARWFHSPGESLASLVAGTLLFHVPVGMWLVRHANRPPGAV